MPYAMILLEATYYSFKICTSIAIRDVEKMSRIMYNIRDIQWEVVHWIVDI